MFEHEVEMLRARVVSTQDRVAPPATPDRIDALAAAVTVRLGFALPESYERFLGECDGFSVDEAHIFGVDADLAAGSDSVAPADPLAGCLAFNIDRRQANAAAGITEPFLYLGWLDESVWCMKTDGTFAEQDATTTEDVQAYPDGATMLRDICRRAAGLS